MCGIYGSIRASKFEVLDAGNQTRGNFASGVFYHNGETYDHHKTQGSFKWTKQGLPDGFLYLGHNQAPTSSARIWSENNCHPFINGNWVVAHNGVLTNFEALKKYVPDHENVVDSSIIPALLNLGETQSKKDTEIDTVSKETALIKNVVELLQGTFGLWIVNLKTLNCYILRQGSTLFFDEDSFSSVKGNGFEPVEQGIIYRFMFKSRSKSHFRVVGNWKAQSPFFEL